MAIGAATVKNGVVTIWDENAAKIAQLPAHGMVILGYTPTRVTLISPPASPFQICYMFDATGKYVGGFLP
jgi:hypothetical protein